MGALALSAGPLLAQDAPVVAEAGVGDPEAQSPDPAPDPTNALVAEGRTEEAVQLWLDMAQTHLAANDRAAALEVLDGAVLALTDAGADNHPAMGRLLILLGGQRVAQSRYDEALAVLARADTLLGGAMTPVEQAAVYSYRAQALTYLHRPEEAEDLARAALALRREHLGADHPLIATSLNQLGLAVYYQARYDEAERIYRDAVAASEAAYGPVDGNVATVLSNLGNVMQRLGREHYAEPIYRRAVRIAETLGDDGLLAVNLVNLGWQLRLMGRSEEADPVFRRSVELMERAWGPDHWFTGIAVADVGLVLGDQERFAEAEPLFVRALGILEGALGENHPDLMITLDGYAHALAGMGRLEEAEALYQRSLDIARQRLVPGHPEATRQTVSVAGFLVDQSRSLEAHAALGQARGAVFGRIASGAERRSVALRSARSLFSSQVRVGWALAHADD